MTIDPHATGAFAGASTHHAPEGITPSQTVGPFFHYALSPREYGLPEIVDNQMASDAAGERVRVVGRVLDGDGEAVTDALVEVWQANAEGRFSGGATGASNTGFTGFGRCAVDAGGGFSFDTVKPGPVPGPEGRVQAPHLDLGIFARGVLRRLFTRVYFEGEAANATDPILALVPEDRRKTLIARRDATGPGASYVFDVRLQGVDETVFFTS